MNAPATTTEHVAETICWAIGAATAVTVCRLDNEHQDEVMSFLEERPAHTFGMVGFITANGLVSRHNRGSFYACRDKQGHLLGVALIGHYILLETRDNSAIEAFAELAKEFCGAHMLLGEQDAVETFWSYYEEGGQAPRRFCRELLLEQRSGVEVRDIIPGLRKATLNDLELVIPAHAQSAVDESGIDPLRVDPQGFRQRCARRIEQGQTWVWIEDGKLVFKAEVLTDTPQVSYLEGVWVDPQERGQGKGSRCMSQLVRNLLKGSSSVCLLVNEQAEGARAFYKRAGYKFIGYYDTVFLKSQTH